MALRGRGRSILGAAMQRLEFKAAWSVTDEGEIEGLAAVFDTVDRGGDVIRKGAFKSARFPVPMLASHDPADVIGTWEAGEETAQGLKVKGRLVLTVARAREVRDLILAKAISGLSIGYTTKRAAKAAGGKVRELLEVELLEISTVAIPMHPGARIVSAKGAAMQEEETMDKEALAAMLAELGFKPESKAAVPDISGAVAEALKPVVQRLDGLEAKGNRAKGDGETNAEPTEERKAFAAYLMRGELAPEAKALTVSTDPTGGYLAPPEVSGEILRDIVEKSPIRSLASVRGTNAPSVIYPTRKPMGNAVWDDEFDAETETTGQPFGSTELTLKGMSTFVDLSNQLMQDAPAVEAEVRAALAEDFELKETAAFANGNGVTQPEGFNINAAIATYKNGHATVVQQDALVKFLYSITPTYRNAGVWAMNGTTLGLLRSMKDGQGNFLWQPSYQAGQPETILGRPVVEIIDMPDVAAGACPIVYADFSGYRIVDRLSLSILVDPYSQATVKRTRFHAGRRVGGKVIMPAKFKKLLMAV